MHLSSSVARASQRHHHSEVILPETGRIVISVERATELVRTASTVYDKVGPESFRFMDPGWN